MEKNSAYKMQKNSAYEHNEEEIQQEKEFHMFKRNKELVTLMENVCEEFEFDVSLYYALVPDPDNEDNEILSAKDQPYVCANDDEDLKKFWIASQEIKV